MHFRATRLIDASPRHVLELATDLRPWTRMFDSIEELRPLPASALTGASRVFAERSLGPLKLRQVLEIGSVSDTGIVLRTDGPGPGRIVVSIQAGCVGGMSKLTIDLSGRLAQPWGLLTPLFERRLRRDWETFLDRLSASLSAPAVPVEFSPPLGRDLV